MSIFISGLCEQASPAFNSKRRRVRLVEVSAEAAGLRRPDGFLLTKGYASGYCEVFSPLLKVIPP
jgi:hypothetical protein